MLQIFTPSYLSPYGCSCSACIGCHGVDEQSTSHNAKCIAPIAVLRAQRAYLGPTTMNTEIAFIMCKMAKVRLWSNLLPAEGSCRAPGIWSALPECSLSSFPRSACPRQTCRMEGRPWCIKCQTSGVCLVPSDHEVWLLLPGRCAAAASCTTPLWAPAACWWQQPPWARRRWAPTSTCASCATASAAATARRAAHQSCQATDPKVKSLHAVRNSVRGGGGQARSCPISR